MRRIRDAYELAELPDLWDVSWGDVKSLVGQEILKPSVRVVAQRAVLHAEERTAEGEAFWVPAEEKVYSGLADLTYPDAFGMLRDGEAYVTQLLLPGPAMLTLCSREGLRYTQADLLVRCDHAEQLQQEVIGLPLIEKEAFDFRLFFYNDIEFAFTLPQARALEFMLEQTRAGAPDQHYTEILKAVGSSSQRLSSLFSRKPYWTRILKKTVGHRGWYHLDPEFVVWRSISS